MARPQREGLRALTSEEMATLRRVSQATSERVDRVQRVRALLAVSAGASFAAAAHAAGFRSGTAVAGLVSRFNRRGLAALRIAPGRGRHPAYDAPARAKIVALAQRTPDRKTDGTGTWSLSTLERTLRREGLPRVGATTIRRVLHAAGSAYQRTRTWCPTGTAVRKRKSGVVTVVDPETEQKRAIRLRLTSSRRTGWRTLLVWRWGVRTIRRRLTRGRIKRSRRPAQVGSQPQSRSDCRTSMSAGEPLSC